MIERLEIKDFAIIDDMAIDFKDGFSVIVGETGTGKSILIEAINLILGARANNSMIKDGCEKSFLTGIFSLSESLKTYLNECDIYYDDKLEIVRVLNTSGKSSYKLNGMTVQLSVVNQIRDMILEVKRQSDNDISSDENFAIKLLDKYSDVYNLEVYKEYKSVYSEYTKVCKKLVELDSIGKNIDIDYVNMQLKRIEQIGLVEGEYEELIEKSKVYANSYKISELIAKVKDNLDDLYSLSGTVNRSVEELNNLGIKFDVDYQEIQVLLEDFTNGFSVDFEEVSDKEIEYIEERIFQIKKMFDLYGDYNGVKQAFDNLNEQLYQYENSASLIVENEKLKNQLESKMDVLCEEVNAHRKEFANTLCNDVKSILTSLYMEDATIKFDFLEANYSEFGNCEIELLISTNNNSYWPIDKIASGGERARVILAIKKLLVENSQVSTIIFDEVDTGVSGRVAKAMGMLMKEISKSTQVISITHLPQVAVCGDYCLSVEKSKENEQVVSNVSYVDGDDKLLVIAKLLSGDIVTEEALNNARSLIDSEV